MSSSALRANKYTAEWINIGDIVETPYYEVKFREDGSIESLYDKELCREWVKGDFNKLRIYTDNPGNYDAWVILPNYKDKQIEVKVKTPLHLIEKDGECATFETVLATDMNEKRLQMTSVPNCSSYPSHSSLSS